MALQKLFSAGSQLPPSSKADRGQCPPQKVLVSITLKNHMTMNDTPSLPTAPLGSGKVRLTKGWVVQGTPLVVG